MQNYLLILRINVAYIFKKSLLGFTQYKAVTLNFQTLNFSPQLATHNELGTKGEQLATDFLQQKGYKVLATNWRNKHHEIDIVAQKKDILVVAEVKTRTGRYFGEPEEFVLKQKQKNLIKAANAYLLIYNLDLEVRFDIISIVVEKEDKFVINHIEDAFSAVV